MKRGRKNGKKKERKKGKGKEGRKEERKKASRQDYIVYLTDSIEAHNVHLSPLSLITLDNGRRMNA
jgi:hypothetical protein